jgi:hypothetical protein
VARRSASRTSRKRSRSSSAFRIESIRFIIGLRLFRGSKAGFCDQEKTADATRPPVSVRTLV